VPLQSVVVFCSRDPFFPSNTTVSMIWSVNRIDPYIIFKFVRFWLNSKFFLFCTIGHFDYSRFFQLDERKDYVIVYSLSQRMQPNLNNSQLPKRSGKC
jgi:hypothetical protein